MRDEVCTWIYCQEDWHQASSHLPPPDISHTSLQLDCYVVWPWGGRGVSTPLPPTQRSDWSSCIAECIHRLAWVCQCTDEGDLWVWLHCVRSSGTKKFIFSPDTDIYQIGLTVASQQPESEIVVQLSKSLKKGSKFVHLNCLLQALQSDPDLHGIPRPLRPQALQSLYVCTGCDYISSLSVLAK